MWRKRNPDTEISYTDLLKGSLVSYYVSTTDSVKQGRSLKLCRNLALFLNSQQGAISGIEKNDFQSWLYLSKHFPAPVYLLSHSFHVILN